MWFFWSQVNRISSKMLSLYSKIPSCTCQHSVAVQTMFCNNRNGFVSSVFMRALFPSFIFIRTSLVCHYSVFFNLYSVFFVLFRLCTIINRVRGTINNITAVGNRRTQDFCSERLEVLSSSHIFQIILYFPTN